MTLVEGPLNNLKTSMIQFSRPKKSYNAQDRLGFGHQMDAREYSRQLTPGTRVRAQSSRLIRAALGAGRHGAAYIPFGAFPLPAGAPISKFPSFPSQVSAAAL